MTVFAGKGIVFDNANGRNLCKFVNGRYETDDKRTIEILKTIPTVMMIGEDADSEEVVEINLENNYSELTKKELIQIAKESGIKGSDRMSKEDILKSLGD